MASSTADLGQLFQSAAAAGDIGQASLQSIQTLDLGQAVQAAMGVSADQVQASSVNLVTMCIDDSGSIRMVAGNTEAVREGHNLVVNALKGTKQKDGILLSTRYINGEIINPYTPVDQVIQLDTHNYNPNKGTPLFDAMMETLATVLAKAQEFQDNGVPVRTQTCFVSDGADMHSVKANASKVRELVKDMLKTENHIIAFMGVDDGGTDFRLIATGCGIPDNWILTPKNSPSEIRKAFGMFSQSAVRASQGAQSFSQTAMGGFANP